MRYKGEKSGRNLKMDNFLPDDPQYKTVGSVAGLIKKIQEKCPWISLHRKRSDSNIQKITQKKIIVEDNGACFEMGTLSLPPFKEKLIGKN